eukprot:CAMPEP_0168567232 /NCGR_PEP_ID=MMETSP0413-20121227/14888_1 /TAXON_ID=136452 /ORGANISM="Filamoeba nolandi, Strain NC-AS-23-1" /LENGTH=324 /DNA_ID=CAMNT_0008599395 /DNA_START=51 /DNA_END=1022 /DNA_ORIENTATION=-
MGTTVFVQGHISNRFKHQVEANLFQNVCIRGFTTTDVQSTQTVKASELIAEMYDDEETQEDEEDCMDLNHFSAPLAFHTVHRSQPMDMNFKSFPSRRRVQHNEEEDKVGYRCRTEWEKRAEYESRLEQRNQDLFNSPKKSSTVFLKMFQARSPHLTCAAAAKIYATIYIRGSNQILTYLSRSETSFMVQFKHQHAQLNRDEWAYLQGFIPADLSKDRLEEHSVFCDFVDVVQRCRASKVAACVASPKGSMLHQMLHSPVRSRGVSGDQSQLSVIECFKLYLCIQYPNYEELWDSNHVVLDTRLKDSIQDFVTTHPVADATLFGI